MSVSVTLIRLSRRLPAVSQNKENCFMMMTEPWLQWLTAVYPQWKSKKTALDNHNDDSDSTWWLHSMLWWFWLLWSLVVWWCRCVPNMINIAKVINTTVRIFWWLDQFPPSPSVQSVHCLARCNLCNSTRAHNLWNLGCRAITINHWLFRKCS